MISIPQNNRYLPHELNTKFYAVKLYRNGNSISFVCRRYKISKSSLMRWNKKFDGTKESLGHAIGKEYRASIVVCDENLSLSIQDKIQ